jgi:threonine/homoserine/homoserine lactone efflux protein
VIDSGTLLAFTVAVLLLFLSPGPNMFFVLSHGVAHGSSGGLAAAFGIVAADIVLTALTATGVTALIAALPASFDSLRVAGALYLLWLAFQAIRSSGKLNLSSSANISTLEIFRRAMLNSLLNPKALLFFMLFLPQFASATRGSVGWQLLTLGAVLTAISLVFHSGLGVFSGVIGQWLTRYPAAARVQSWFLASVMTLLALRLLWLERPS